VADRPVAHGDSRVEPLECLVALALIGAHPGNTDCVYLTPVLLAVESDGRPSSLAKCVINQGPPNFAVTAPTAAQAALQALQADCAQLLSSSGAPAREGRPFDEARSRRRYQAAIERVMGMFQDRRNVAPARDGLREMILGGRIRLRPAGDDRLAGAVELDGLSQLVVLEGRNTNGSGGPIWDGGL
jgi:hypothetical protein